MCVDLLQLRADGYRWSRPFSVGSEGVMSVLLESDTEGIEMNIRVAVRTGIQSSRYEVVFRPNSFSSPYRFNLSPKFDFLVIHRAIVGLFG